MWLVPSRIFQSAPDMEVLTLESSESFQALEQSLTLNAKSRPAKSWLTRWKKGTLIWLRFGQMLKLSQRSIFAEWWTSSLAGIRVSRSALPVSEQGQKTRAICGHTSETSLDLFGPESVSLKTSGGTFDWDCQKCLENSEDLATELGRAYSQRRKSVPRTGESACLSWPTVTTSESTGGKHAPGKQGGQSLRSAVELWPTASARDYKDTPGMQTEATNPDGSHRKRTDQLARAVYWRTPSASDGEGGAFDMQHARENNMKPKFKLPCPGPWPARPGESQHEWEQPRTIDRKLNPSWVAQLMGLPHDWVNVLGLTREMKLRALGNGVVPQQAEHAIRTLLKARRQ